MKITSSRRKLGNPYLYLYFETLLALGYRRKDMLVYLFGTISHYDYVFFYAYAVFWYYFDKKSVLRGAFSFTSYTIQSH